MLFLNVAGISADNAADDGQGRSLHYQNVPRVYKDAGLAPVLRCAQASDGFEHDRCAGELVSEVWYACE